MVPLIPEHPVEKFSSLPLAIGLFISISALVALCAKHVRRAPAKHDHQARATSNTGHDHQYSISMVPKSPLASSKQFVSSLSNKANPFNYKKKGGAHGDEVDHEGFGEGGLWQKAILMGEKCRPPKFSGVIYYDSYGNQISEMPRSPRASPLPGYSIPEARDGC